MRIVRTCLLMGGLLLLGLGTAFAQAEEPVGILEYYDDDFEIVVRDADGFEYNFFLGMELVPGDTIETFNSTAEVRLVPNGSIIKVGTNTEFTIDELQGREGGSTNGFSVAAGRIRNVAASVSGQNYRVRTPSTVAGVRGTDFGVEVSTDRDAVAVLEGSVEVTNRSTGESVMLGANQYVNALGDTFRAIQLSAEQMGEIFRDVSFNELNPQEVPGQETGDGQQEADQAPDEDDGEVADVDTTEEVPSQPDEEGTVDGDGGLGQEDSALQQAFARAAEVLGMEIGSVTLDGNTYAKLVFQPVVELGRLRAALYLPFIYQRDLFDPDDWYKPKGNNEWNFGFGSGYSWEDRPGEAALDLLRDTALKFRFVEFGEQRDPFFIKVGNLNNMVLGHGVLVDNYANDVDFPAVRRIGLNGGLSFGRFGLEFLLNDIAEPEIMGARPYMKPFGEDSRLATGLSAMADLDPAGDLPAEEDVNPDTTAETREAFADARTSDPIMLHLAGDLDFPIIERDLFSIIGFSDFGTVLPYLRNSVTLSGPEGEDLNRTPGLQDYAAYDRADGEIESYATMTGLFGTLFGLDYQLDFRAYKGFIRPGFYDGNYDRRRGEYAADLMNYLSDPDAAAYEQETLGIYGEAGFGLFNDNLTFDAGYLWPFSRNETGGITGGDEDFLKLELFVDRELTPLDIQGSFVYKRTAFVPTLLNEGEFENASLFDANTVLSGELIYPVAPTLNIAVVAKTVMIRDDNGTIQYNDRGEPIIGPSFGIETRLGF